MVVQGGGREGVYRRMGVYREPSVLYCTVYSDQYVELDMLLFSFS